MKHAEPTTHFGIVRAILNIARSNTAVTNLASFDCRLHKSYRKWIGSDRQKMANLLGVLSKPKLEAIYKELSQ